MAPAVDDQESAASEQRLLTVQEVADRLVRSVGWVRQRCAAGEIAHLDLGTPRRSVLRFRPEAVEAFITERERPAFVEPPDPYGRVRRGGRRTGR